MDGWVIVGLVAVVLPVAVIWALAKSASLRGSEHRPGHPRRRVESLVTEVIADDRPEEERDVPDDLPGRDDSERGRRLPPDSWR